MTQTSVFRGLAAMAVCMLAACASSPQTESGNQSSTGAGNAASAVNPNSVATVTAPSGQGSGGSGGAGGGAVSMPSERSVYFAFDKADVQDRYRSMLKANAEYLSKNPKAAVELQGNCDERGSREYNLALGQKRAETVKQMLVVSGVPATRIDTVSYGEEKPRAQGHDESAWAENRRADFSYR
jgi:peptidoglycan-associated lipoprotein